ncbi:hypothetical protein [Cellulosilyticum ruminicola]|uniref:hypothetical protein n=1 Tax=Cellulosilyticum ruminicola TaxID=425254 RepID=UPI0006D0AA60|nr:hypothetical protein [Cellulosilyticum ruminicola]
MKRIGAIVSSSLKNNFQAMSLVVVYLGILLICTATIGFIGCKVVLGAALASSQSPENIAYYIEIIAYSSAIVLTGISYTVLFSVPLAREKTRGNIEALLATRVTERELLVAKSLALFVPGFIAGEGIPFLMSIFMGNKYLGTPFAGFRDPIMVIGIYVAVPIVYYCLSILMHLISLTGGVEGGTVVATIFLPCVAAVGINLLARQTIDGRTGAFLIFNGILMVILLCICLCVRHRFRKETIILSCRK